MSAETTATPEVVPAAELVAAPPDFAAFEAAENAADVSLSDPAKVTSTATEAKPAATTATTETTQAAAAATTTTQPDKSYTPPKAGSRRSEKDQAHVNEVIRKATEAAQAEAAKNVEELRKELADLRAKATPATPAAESAAQPKPAIVADQKDPEPQEADFDSFPEFIRASALWAVRQDTRQREAAKAESDQRESAAKAQNDAVDRFNAWVERRNAFTEANPERAARLGAYVETIHAGTPIGDTIMDSEFGAEVADYLAAHPDEAARIGALPPISAIRALGRLEATFSTPSPTTSASASAGPAARTVTQAPAPPTTLAARSADVADPIAAAIAGGNYLAFEAEENRRDALRH